MFSCSINEIEVYMSSSLLLLVGSLVKQIEPFNAAVARKLSMAVSQLEEAKSVEEYQQLGILIRDTLIEFGQSIYSKDMLGTGMTAPSNSDAKRLIEYALEYYSVNHEHFGKVLKACFDYANAIEHDSNIRKEHVLQALSITALCIALVIETITQSIVFNKRPYYKCPNCGSLDLEVKEHWEHDIDAAWKMDKIVCCECGWFYIEEMGGMSGVE
jgi:hypothetical protein